MFEGADLREEAVFIHALAEAGDAFRSRMAIRKASNRNDGGILGGAGLRHWRAGQQASDGNGKSGLQMDKNDEVGQSRTIGSTPV